MCNFFTFQKKKKTNIASQNYLSYFLKQLEVRVYPEESLVAAGLLPDLATENDPSIAGRIHQANERYFVFRIHVYIYIFSVRTMHYRGIKAGNN